MGLMSAQSKLAEAEADLLSPLAVSNITQLSSTFAQILIIY